MQGNTNAVGLNKSDILDVENNFTRTQTICSDPSIINSDQTASAEINRLTLDSDFLRLRHHATDGYYDILDINNTESRINTTIFNGATGRIYSRSKQASGYFEISPTNIILNTDDENTAALFEVNSNGISWNGLNIIDTTANKLALSAMPYTEGENITISNTGVISAAGVTIDSEFNSSSNNPLANSVITNYLQGSSLALGGSASVGSMAVALGPSSIAADYSTAVGHGAISRGTSTAVGYGAMAELNGVALGKDAISNANGAVQLGTGTNAESNTLQFRSYQLLDATGLIPVARIPNTIARAADVAVDQTYNSTSSYAQSGVAVAEAISGKQDTSNLVTAISSSSTDNQYPSAKCVYDIIGNLETILAAL